MTGAVRLLLTIPDLSGGGAEREMVNLARALPRERFEVHLLLHRAVFDHPLPEDVTLHYAPRTQPWHTPSTIRSIRGTIDALEPDLVFSQLHYSNLLTGSALARSRHRARWVCRHTGDPRREMRWPFATWARRALARADCVVGCSEGVSRALREHLRLQPGRVATLANLVDVANVTALSNEALVVERKPAVFTVAHAGRLVPQKNQALLLDAFAALGDRPAELWMLGDGPLRERLVARARARGIAGRVRWLGFHPNPFPFLRAADVFALSSDREGLPNVLIESALCGTPAVATRCPYGPDELIDDGRDGLLVPAGDALALGGALAALADSPRRRREMGERARARATSRFESAKVCDSYEHLFQRVLETAPARS
jgi:glycosyltransferase involved in cell wall biosynthesis